MPKLQPFGSKCYHSFELNSTQLIAFFLQMLKCLEGKQDISCNCITAGDATRLMKRT